MRKKSRNRFGLIEKNNLFNVDENLGITVENESELSVMKHETECSKKKLHKKESWSQYSGILQQILISLQSQARMVGQGHYNLKRSYFSH